MIVATDSFGPRLMVSRDVELPIGCVVPPGSFRSMVVVATDPLTLSILVSALLSVLERGEAELGSVFAVVSEVSVCTEEVNVRSEDVPSPDAVPPGIEVDISRGGLVLFMISPAGPVSGEKK